MKLTELFIVSYALCAALIMVAGAPEDTWIKIGPTFAKNNRHEAHFLLDLALALGLGRTILARRISAFLHAARLAALHVEIFLVSMLAINPWYSDLPFLNLTKTI